MNSDWPNLTFLLHLTSSTGRRSSNYFEHDCFQELKPKLRKKLAFTEEIHQSVSRQPFHPKRHFARLTDNMTAGSGGEGTSTNS
jgi:hypothetical protein